MANVAVTVTVDDQQVVEKAPAGGSPGRGLATAPGEGNVNGHQWIQDTSHGSAIEAANSGESRREELLQRLRQLQASNPMPFADANHFPNADVSPRGPPAVNLGALATAPPQLSHSPVATMQPSYATPGSTAYAPVPQHAQQLQPQHGQPQSGGYAAPLEQQPVIATTEYSLSTGPYSPQQPAAVNGTNVPSADNVYGAPVPYAVVPQTQHGAAMDAQHGAAAQNTLPPVAAHEHAVLDDAAAMPVTAPQHGTAHAGLKAPAQKAVLQPSSAVNVPAAAAAHTKAAAAKPSSARAVKKPAATASSHGRKPVAQQPQQQRPATAPAPTPNLGFMNAPNLPSYMRPTQAFMHSAVPARTAQQPSRGAAAAGGKNGGLTVPTARRDGRTPRYMKPTANSVSKATPETAPSPVVIIRPSAKTNDGAAVTPRSATVVKRMVRTIFRNVVNTQEGLHTLSPPKPKSYSSPQYSNASPEEGKRLSPAARHAANWGDSPSLDNVLVKHKSRLEREKEAFKESQKQAQQ